MVIRPLSGRNPLAGSSVVRRHWRAKPFTRTEDWSGIPISGSERGTPEATRICDFTRSTSVTSSVTVCSTWIRGFTSMKKKSPVSASTRNSTVPAFS